MTRIIAICFIQEIWKLKLFIKNNQICRYKNTLYTTDKKNFSGQDLIIYVIKIKKKIVNTYIKQSRYAIQKKIQFVLTLK